MDKNELINKLKSKERAPFLFLGSGFSRHYIGTPDWKGMLSLFAPKHINQYYSQLATDSLPKIASSIAKDITELFWSLPSDNDFKVNHIEEVIDQSIVLKIKIAEFLRKKSIEDFPEEYKEEICLLSRLCIDGIITTNWDDTVERIFPTFKSYIGQQELIFSSTFNIGEIYKIHGCMTKPTSMVLTEEDYNDFNKRNAYLAAKLITIFIEHPIIFMGYSISDKNIIDLLKTIVGCMDKKNMEKLRDNLIFVEWNADENAILRIDSHTINLQNNIILPVTRIETHNYIDVYKCLSFFERTIPAKFLREYKKQFYEIVVSEKPEKQLYVLPDSKIDNNKQIQVVYGFGAVSKFTSATGYIGLTAQDLFNDILEDNGLNSMQVLTKSIPHIRRSSNVFLPCYKYLSDIGIHCDEDFARNQLGINIPLRSLKDFQDYPSFSDEDKRMALDDVIKKYRNNNVWKAVALIPYLNIKKEELDMLKDFIKEHFNEFLIKKNGHSTQMRKLICFYDWFKFGWHN